MKTFKKTYLGKGKKIQNLRIVKVTCRLEDLQSIAYDFEGTNYVTFEIAQMMKPDGFGRTHTCYYRQEVEDQPELSPAKPAKKPAKEIAVTV
ncbi:MAG: hypothetical protein M0Q26_13515 [Chitinophagaceae bacterium]|nr:hypothetical protein [Chitinophagaceae bacterium]